MAFSRQLVAKFFITTDQISTYHATYMSSCEMYSWHLTSKCGEGNLAVCPLSLQRSLGHENSRSSVFTGLLGLMLHNRHYDQSTQDGLRLASATEWDELL